MAESDAPRRPRRSSGTTKLGHLVSAALAVADRAGVDGVTMRAVAKQAEVPTMSLYGHLASKGELLDLMYAEIVRRLYTGEQLPTWKDELRALCDRVRSTLLAHPRWVPLLSRAATPLEVPARERLLVLMTADGMTPRQAFDALISVFLIAEGLVLLELALTAPDGRSAIAQSFERLRALADAESSATLPTTRSAISESNGLDLTANYAFAVETYVSGLTKRRGANSIL